ncbi:2-C-methyl-D-erythritol 4-phosphate cytidylyltransferase [Desulfobacula sp.]|uniref:2-C-methyl-D-erythritol 4-phosphate cytidylyltransferase n=1 Tax=Desulfobacula sp. TaxID=2593537 RepID=UPI0026238AE7|nr:2-C-methyl-D-erythritol 4-phosphate cytidylyltransferase [Desulfobacula sp.]
MSTSENFVIIVAAGKGLRMGSKMKKQYLYLGKMPILTRTIMAFDRCDLVHEIVLVVPREEMGFCQQQMIDPFGLTKKIHLVTGGKYRQDSVLNGLTLIRDRMNCERNTIVMIHDGVRPFVDHGLIESCIQKAGEYGACIPAVRITDTVKDVSGDGFIQQTLNRETLYKAQTPQTFKMALIWRAFEHAGATSFSGTDDASIVEHYGCKVMITRGSDLNIKLTTPDDLALGQYLLTRD